jgi:murein DD-endopeptidase MepM/ murein hydrolase activator NlpD
MLLLPTLSVLGGPSLGALVLALAFGVPSTSAPAPVPDAPPPPAATSSTWRAPVDPAVLLAPFDPPARAWLPGHRGVDLGSGQGDAVRSAGPGDVSFAGPLAGRGVVVVVHLDGLRTTYEPVDATVQVGQHVEAGEVIGTLGRGDVHCGRPPGCLHWGLRRGRDYLDPWRLLHPGRAVLLAP